MVTSIIFLFFSNLGDVMVAGKLYKFKFKNNEYGVYKTKTDGKIVLLEQ